MKIGILKEGKIPVDHRVPFTPEQCKEIINNFPDTEIVIQPSSIRCFGDNEYAEASIQLQANLSDCDILMGVKEVPIKNLIADKTYFFFSHTIKKQPYNKGLLQTVLTKNIKLIDYETLKLNNGKRVVAFGRFAGIVGAYNGLLTYGKKFNRFELKPANECFDMKEMWEELKKVNLSSIKLAITGNGRVAQGAIEILNAINLEEVTIDEYLERTFEKAVFTVLDSHDYNKRIDGNTFNFEDFHKKPTEFEGTFRRFLPMTDILIAGAYWDPKAPLLFDKNDVKNNSFKPSVIADITCDIKGSIPTTVRPSTIAHPVYDIDKNSLTELNAYSSKETLSVMAVDNLPCELSRDASHSFGEQLIKNVLPSLLIEDDGLIKRAAITTTEGTLNTPFFYLEDYIK
jgi:saccharopine dehydrogenase (NAD+, L-lysine-forming)